MDPTRRARILDALKKTKETTPESMPLNDIPETPQQNEDTESYQFEEDQDQSSPPDTLGE